MSGGRFLGSVVAAREGAYFLQQSKAAVGNLLSRDHVATATATAADPTPPPSSFTADVLPEVLRHSLPLSPPPHSPASSSSSKWTIPSAPPPRSGASLNPISAYISLPQATFGPKRWELPRLEHAVIASTANELRTDRYSRVSPENVKAVASVAQVGKASVIATILIFGGATCACSIATSKLHIHSSDDIKVRTRDILQPKVKVFKDQVVPLQAWIERRSRKWHIEGGDLKERPMVKELLKTLGGRSSS